MNNDEKVREMLEKEPIPQELEPENIKAMLDEKAPRKKRSGISAAGRLAAAAAACAVIGGGSYNYLSRTNKTQNEVSDNSRAYITSETESSEESTTAPAQLSKLSYMNCAKDYDEIYALLEKQSLNYNNSYKSKRDFLITNNAITESAIEFDSDTVGESAKKSFNSAAISAAGSVNTAKGEDYKQEEEDAVYAGEASPQTEAPEVYFEQEEEPDVTIPETEPPTEAQTEAHTEATTKPDDEPAETTEPSTEEATEETADESTEEEDFDAAEHSDTHNQEENVLEADIAKTDGKYIYYISNTTNNENGEDPVLRTAKVKDGKFLSSDTEYISNNAFFGEGNDTSTYVEDMYLYNDMIAIVGNVFSYDDNYNSNNMTYVAFYTSGSDPELIDVYYQDGSYNDVRIAPDGFMYLVTDFTSASFDQIEEEENYELYIPECGLSNDCRLVSPECILLPPDDEEKYNLCLSYSVIGSIDLNESGKPEYCETKSLADYSGELYASADNFYASAVNDNGTDITRISIGNGSITPASTVHIDNATLNDQFSMSEYNGFFRVAVTRSNYVEVNKSRWWDKLTGNDYGSYTTLQRDNAVYVYDLDFNLVGSLEGFGDNESVKSVSFQGDMAYVVTYEKTDPLFAIDLSEPSSPTILDSFKINGYSTYMQQWSDGLLLGFGINADDNAIETGVKLVMFDNSDPNNLKEVGFYSIDRSSNEWVYSQAINERKALLIAPEKNLIGFPLERNSYDEVGNYNYSNSYIFFSYENGRFIEKGSIESVNPDMYDEYNYNRAMYIGDYVYVLSGAKFTAADIETLTISDELSFNGEEEETEETTTTTTTDDITETTTTTVDETTTETSEDTIQTETVSILPIIID